LNYFHDPPPFVFRQRSAFHDFHHVADVAYIVFIMRLKTGGMPDNLVIQRMPAQVLNLHNNRLLHLIAGYLADPNFAVLFHFLLLAKLPLGYYRVYPGDPFLYPGQFAMIYQLLGCQLEAQVKQLLVSFLQFFLQFGIAKRPDFTEFHFLPLL
jgi:hypothetical protein